MICFLGGGTMIGLFIKWYDGYKKRKAQKISIKEVLMSIAWHPSRYWHWCMSEDEKKRDRKIVEVNIGFFYI